MRKTLLEESQIPCVVVNRQCRSYTGVGFASVEVDLKVTEKFAETASKLLENGELLRTITGVVLVTVVISATVYSKETSIALWSLFAVLGIKELIAKKNGGHAGSTLNFCRFFSDAWVF